MDSNFDFIAAPKKRGRPKKVQDVIHEVETPEGLPKKKRGRPKKVQDVIHEVETPEGLPKKKRGRPRKQPLADYCAPPYLPKGTNRGRPKKGPTEMAKISKMIKKAEELSSLAEEVLKCAQLDDINKLISALTPALRKIELFRNKRTQAQIEELQKAIDKHITL